jgi:hypothetical protein
MCRTLEDSVTAGLISTLTSLVLFSTKKPAYIWLGAFLLTIGLTQWIDAYVWYVGAKTPDANAAIRYGTGLVLALEPLVSYGGLVYATQIRFSPLYELCLPIFSVMLYVYWISLCDTTPISNDGFLKWCNSTPSFFVKASFLFFLIVPFLWFPDPFLRILAITICTAGFIYSLTKEAFGSHWCYSVNALSGLALLRLAY